MKPAPFTHCVFDAYGTLFDVHSAVGRYRKVLGEKADPVSILWRTKQLEYTWLRSLMRYANRSTKTRLESFDGDIDYEYDWDLNALSR